MTDKFRLWRPKESFLPSEFPKFNPNRDPELEPYLPRHAKIISRRKINHLRKCVFLPNTIHNANGSCYVEQGHTKVLVTVHGPMSNSSSSKSDLDSLTINAFFKFSPFSSELRKNTGPETKKEKLNSRLLIEAITPIIQLNEYPKMEITVSCLVIEDDGSSLAAAITASSIALAKAGLKMYDLAVGLSYDVEESQLIIDPNNENPDITLSYLPSIGQFSLFEINTSIDDAVLDKLIENSKTEFNQIYSDMVESM